MPSYDPPQDLIDLQRAFFATDRDCQEAADALPPSMAIAEGTAEPTPEQRKRLDDARNARLQAMDALHAHPWWQGVGNLHLAKMAVRKAAQDNQT